MPPKIDKIELTDPQIEEAKRLGRIRNNHHKRNRELKLEGKPPISGDGLNATQRKLANSYSKYLQQIREKRVPELRIKRLEYDRRRGLRRSRKKAASKSGSWAFLHIPPKR